MNETSGRSITSLKICALSDLQIGDYSTYPVDKFHFRWVAYQEIDHRFPAMSTHFIPLDMMEDWAKRLTGRRLWNKMYVICHISDSKILAIYQHDDMTGLIEITGVKYHT